MAKAKALIIVESPAKAKKITDYVSADTKVMASVGHIRDLPNGWMGINREKDPKDPKRTVYIPNYEVPRDKKKVVDELRKAAANVSTVYLASDPDREGESIAWHLYEVLKDLPGQRKFYRVRYNEITKPAVLAALAKPSEIDLNLVDAQQARRIEDRLSGFTLSKMISNAVKGAKSAGRVQSVALRLIVDRERLVSDFRPTPYHVVSAVLSKGTTFEAQLNKVDGETPKFMAIDKEIYGIAKQEVADAYLDDLRGRNAVVTAVERKVMNRRPQAPFMTSTLQQAASTHLGYSPDVTMQLAQRLYEEGLITYMRTDGTYVSDDVRPVVNAEIKRLFGEEHLPKTPNIYKTKVKNAQEAHEAIRPTDVRRNVIDEGADPRQAKLYDLIWRRFMASQMAPAQIERTTVFFAPIQPPTLQHDYRFSASTSKVIFQGYLAAWPNVRPDLEDGDVRQLPNLAKGDEITCLEWKCVSKETQPPARYNEASLVKDLEEKGIGRPSTYASTIRTLLDRKYVESGRNHVLTPTEIGVAATDYLLKEVSEFVDVAFTTVMEDALDTISVGELDWQQKVGEFDKKLSEWLTAPASRVRDITQGLAQVTQWKEPVKGKTPKATWDDQKFYAEMAKAERVTKPQLATLERMVYTYRSQIANWEALIGPQPDAPDEAFLKELFAKIETMELNEWETKFTASTRHQFETKGTLSQKQVNLLVKIVGRDAEGAPAEADENRPDNEAASTTLLMAFKHVTTWNEPLKRGRRVLDDHAFVSSLQEQLSKKHYLTERQFEALKKMVRTYREQVPNYADLAATYGIKEPAPRRATATRKATPKKRATTKKA